MVHRFITYVVGKIHVDLCHSVYQQKVTDLIKRIAVIVHPHHIHRQAHIEQDFDAIFTDVECVCEVARVYSVFSGLRDPLKYSQAQQTDYRLEADRRKRDFLCF